MKCFSHTALLIILLSILFDVAIKGQSFSDSTFVFADSIAPISETEFQFSGKPIVSVFTNYSMGLDRKNLVSNNFQITRAYLGYQCSLGDNLTSEIILDVGQDTSEFSGYSTILRNAYLRYHNNKFTVSMGMIPTLQVMIHDEFWGYRYLLKSYQNKYGYGSSADLGISMLYQWNKMIYLDASILNGEGYKNVATDSVLKYSIGATLFPSRDFKFRVYYDFSKVNQEQTVSLFLGYKIERLSLGVEYDFQFNHDAVANNNLWGGSIFSTYRVDEKSCVMTRIDLVNSNEVNGIPWNSNNNGTLFLIGVEHIFNKNIRLSPNLRFWNPNSDSKWEKALYLNLKFNI